MFKLIAKVGLELEGGWDKKREDLVPDAGIRMEEFHKSVCCGEYVSKPIDNYEELEAILIKNWPTETNDMSGFHIHMSFKDISSYVSMMNKKFKKYFTEYMTKWGETYPINNNQFWERLENRNKFCKDEFRAEEQIFLTQKKPNDPGRYTQLHYAYGLHKTLEVRLLPTFISVDTAVAGLKAVLTCVESYLEINPPKPFSFSKEEIVEENAHPDEELNLNEGGKIGSKKFNKVQPFNLFMERGLVMPSKYDMDSFYRNDNSPVELLVPQRGKIALDKAFVDRNTIYNGVPKNRGYGELPKELKTQFVRDNIDVKGKKSKVKNDEWIPYGAAILDEGA